jgi:hypothetical protein
MRSAILNHARGANSMVAARNRQLPPTTIRFVALSMVCLAVGSCGAISDGTSACDDVAREVIQVDVYDSLSGMPAAAGATVELRGAAFSDSLTVPDTASTATAQEWFERGFSAGTYSVQVLKSGYMPWTSASLVLESNACHVFPFQHVIARLQR